MTVTEGTIRLAIRDLGLTGRPICVHSSLKSFGWVEGGAAAVVRGLLAEGCTVLVPAFSSVFFAPPPRHLQPARNGTRYDYPVALVGETPRPARIYDPDSGLIDRGMGAIPAAVVATAGRSRGKHPTGSFAAVGPLAERLIEAQSAGDINAPLRMLAQLNGAVICMGVTLTRLTLLHLAEQRAGREMFRRWARAPSGEVIMVEAGGCSQGFDNLASTLAPLLKERLVGECRWLVYPAGAAVEAAAAAIRAGPRITHCDDPACERCNDAFLGGPIL